MTRFRGGGFLRQLDWKVVMASGLSAAAIVGVYKVSDGAQAGLKTTAALHPAVFGEVVVRATRFLLWPIPVILLLAGVCLLWPWLSRRRLARSGYTGEPPRVPETGKSPRLLSTGQRPGTTEDRP